MFQEDVPSLVDAFKNLGGNMFLETSGKLFDLKYRIIMPDEVVESVTNLESVGQKKYELFVKESLVSDPCLIQSNTVGSSYLDMDCPKKY